MKFKALCFFASLLFLIDAKAQNLVPNPSFEEYSECPTTLDGMHYVDHWYKSIQYPGVPYFENPSPDYFHVCAEGTALGVPENFIGNIFAFEGQAYAGLIVYHNNSQNAREVIGVELNNTLVPGVEYFLNMRVCLASGQGTGWASSNLGVKLTTFELFNSTIDATDNITHLVSEEIITDTLNWIELQGSFIADQPYHYIHIGNFFETSEMELELLGEIPFAIIAYYYIDAVYLGAEPIATNIIHFNVNNNFEINMMPNPTTGHISFDGINESVRISIYDSKGALMLDQKFENGLDNINIENYNKGLYLIVIQDYDGKIQVKKIIKN